LAVAAKAAFASSSKLLEQGSSAGHDRKAARRTAPDFLVFIILLLRLPDKPPLVRGILPTNACQARPIA
jgi:hypothetical protein